MRIVIDLQGAQSTASRNRGVGRYSLALAQGIAKHRGTHEILIALSSLFPHTIDPIRGAFSGLLPCENILIWDAPASLSETNAKNSWRREAAEHLREAFLANLNPDAILVTSLFEGLVDDAVTSIGKFDNSPPTVVVLYDLIPWIHQNPYLDKPDVRIWYERKIRSLRKAQLWLAISESSRQEGLKHLSLPEDAVVNISTAADAQFRRQAVFAPFTDELPRKLGLTRPFLMYTGGIDHRKNIEGLICAYAAVPVSVRTRHQLVIVCAIQPESRKALEQLAAQTGLIDGELVLPGFVSEEELIALYRQCKAFVFPSWHEGFGLPALEAMHCGAAVIAANTSSLPEVIGNEEALFDPFDKRAITEKIIQVLSNEAFRQRLISHGLQQAQKFSWDLTARRAIDALEAMSPKRESDDIKSAVSATRPKLAYISPLPPERSGIADYSAELLPALAQHYDIDVVVAQKEVSDVWVKANLPIRTIEWLRKNAAAFQHLLYHFGNSPFHEHMFDLLEEYPGTVVLHDFYLGHIQSHRDFIGHAPGSWTRELYHSHGFVASRNSVNPKNPGQVAFQYPCNWSVLEQATGVIVHSSFSKHLAKEWYGSHTAENWSVIPLMRTPANSLDRAAARQTLGFSSDDFVVTSFGMLGSTKLNSELLDAWMASTLSKENNCHLIFVGEIPKSEYGTHLEQKISDSGYKRIRISGWVNSSTYQQYLTASDLGVQLRTRSRGETSAAVLDCLNYGIPTIINSNGSMADLPAAVVHMLPDAFSIKELTEALEFLWKNPIQRQFLSIQGRTLIRTHYDPSACAEQYFYAIERAAITPKNHKKRTLQAISGIHTRVAPTDADLCATAQALTYNLGNPAGRQLLLDVSTIIRVDSRTGIQRVVRSLLGALLSASLFRIEVRPIYFDQGCYRYANHLVCTVSGLSPDAVDDDLVDFFDGDIYLALDLNMHLAAEMHVQHEHMRTRGVELFFIVYDILLLQRPDWWPVGASSMFQQWMQLISQVATGLLCISDAVAQDVRRWLQCTPPQRSDRALQIESFHLGADVQGSLPSHGMPDTAAKVLVALKARTSFLMVGTIEPRKGHAQTLAAFDILWERGIQANLVIVGKSGWMVGELQQQLRHHTEAGQRLFWLEGISDEYLEQAYQLSSCLIAASEGEGFGLPLIEAAQHKLPLIARELPVFREVAGVYAYYFEGLAPHDLAAAVERWLTLYANGQHPRSDTMSWLTWHESAAQLLQRLLPPERPEMQAK